MQPTAEGNGMKDAWESGDPYERFMGRWSRLVAHQFLQWLSPAAGLKWIDVGCGTGALSEAVLHDASPAELIAIDQSDGFIRDVQERLGGSIRGKVGNALDLPLEDSTADCAVSGLVLNFIPDPIAALAEMRRATVDDGTVAVYVWDYAGKMEFLNCFWDAAIALDPKAASRHEARRFPNANPQALKAQFDAAGLVDVVSAPVEIATHFSDFNDYWEPFNGGQGPAPTYLQSLDETDRKSLRDALVEQLPFHADGSLLLTARAWAVKGTVPSQQ